MGVDLSCFLNECAARTEGDGDAVAVAASVDVMLATQSSSQAHLQQLSEHRHAVQTAAEEARVTHLLRNLAERVVGEETSEDADA